MECRIIDCWYVRRSDNLIYHESVDRSVGQRLITALSGEACKALSCAHVVNQAGCFMAVLTPIFPFFYTLVIGCILSVRLRQPLLLNYLAGPTDFT